jgi:hypothetical protein
LSSFLCSVNCLPQAWLLVGQAVRTAQDLGLHVSGLSESLQFNNSLIVLFSVRLADLPLHPSKKKPVARSGGAFTH